MNLTTNTRWAGIDDKTYLIVTIAAADNNTGAVASQIYLDLQLPEGARIRHIGDLSTDGHGKSIGVDIPDLTAGEQRDIVFRVKSRQTDGTEITPELHLHWIDSESGDLLERHQTGTQMPTEQTEADQDLETILADARSRRTNRTHRQGHTNEHRGRGRRARNRHQWQGEDSMTTPEQEITRHPRRGRRHGHGTGHEVTRYGQHAGPHMRRVHDEPRGDHAASGGRKVRRHGKGHLYRMMADMQDQIDMMERKMRRMQRRARMHAMSMHDGMETRETRREITRTRRTMEPGVIPPRSHHGRRMHGEGRKLGRMMHRAMAESRQAIKDRQADA